jgi:hypothetical protein
MKPPPHMCTRKRMVLRKNTSVRRSGRVGISVTRSAMRNRDLYETLLALSSLFRPWSPNYRKTPAELSGTKVPAHTCVSRSRQLLRGLGRCALIPPARRVADQYPYGTSTPSYWVRGINWMHYMGSTYLRPTQ